MYASTLRVVVVALALMLAPLPGVHASPAPPEGRSSQPPDTVHAPSPEQPRAARRWRCGKPKGSMQFQRCVRFTGTDWKDVTKAYPVYLRNRQRRPLKMFCEATESRTAHWTVGALAEVEAGFVLAKAKASISSEFGKSRTLTVGYGARDVRVPARSFVRCQFGVARPTLHGKLRTSYKEPGQAPYSRVEPFTMRLPTGPYADIFPARPL